MDNSVPLELIETRICTVRGLKVMIDADLADLYGVPTKVLLQAVRRNIDRFPADFMLQVDRVEYEALRSRFVTSKKGGRGGRRYLPYVFTEQGVAMLSSVLNSDRAIQANIAIMRAFVKLREMALTHKDLARRLDALEEKYDVQFKVVFDAIRELMAPPEAEGKKRKIGFLRDEEGKL